MFINGHVCPPYEQCLADQGVGEHDPTDPVSVTNKLSGGARVNGVEDVVSVVSVAGVYAEQELHVELRTDHRRSRKYTDDILPHPLRVSFFAT